MKKSGKIRNILVTSAGFGLLGLGAVGVFLPLLPTTPLVLAASACFAGNPAARAKVLRIRFFREHLVNYQTREGLKKGTVVKSLVFLWAALCVSIILMGQLWSLFLLCSVGVGVTIHILHMAKPKA